MNKLPLILALALVLAPVAFADKSHHKGEKEIPVLECSKYEFKDDGNLYVDGKLDVGGIGNILSASKSCGGLEKIRGGKEYNQRQQKDRERNYEKQFHKKQN